MIIGIAGQPSSGKDTFSTYLESKYDFHHISTSDYIRQYVRDNNLGSLDRETLRETANLLRRMYGADYLMKTALENAQGRTIISGIRNIMEAMELKKAGGTLVVLECPIEQRYKWATSRNRAGDGLITFEEFKLQQQVEEKNADENAQNVLEVIKMGDSILKDYCNFEELYQRIDELMKKI